MNTAPSSPDEPRTQAAGPAPDAGGDVSAWTRRQQALYNGIAPHYDAAIPEHVAAHYRAKRVDLVGSLAVPGARVLDVGCGTGTLSKALGAAGYRVYGLDSSVGMLGQLGNAGRGVPAAGFGERL